MVKSNLNKGRKGNVKASPPLEYVTNTVKLLLVTLRMPEEVRKRKLKWDKKKDLKENAPMSKNAQFRGIQPSPSILSFEDDNLLGRRGTIEIQRAGYNTELSAPLDNIPFSTNPERERIKENIFRNKLQFFAVAKVSSSFPPPDIPEIAFAVYTFNVDGFKSVRIVSITF
ncbi:hypothetical protein F3Y22_tig00112408pilonHSYRG00031 [Hibiscus syriacus]|uniref:Uncharacterized protein n=1 Tax=Hibiscus syriacus TaxID=106335 RepID=A0A6A2X014_HIBSY|nr:hypothetical protein F3Y22_tig00112408pilonHSYRG00031 [Hibiscus syriacus]